MRCTIPALLLVLVALANQPVAAQGAWQQHVAYEMDIQVLADRHQLRGHQRLTYTNHAPDTLHQVFYHLYFNAFQPGSMMAERNRHLPDPDRRITPRIWNLGPDEIGYHEVHTLTQDGQPLAFDVFDTVLRAPLARPIPPGGTAVFEMSFHAQVPLQTRRNGRDNAEGVDFSMSQWYPKLAAYDARGWHADPYVGREFYAPFGRFDVRLTLPAEYVVGGTGVLQNPAAIGHGYANPTQRPANADSLTWHFVAENVHDFAWAADPNYQHDQIVGDDGVTYHLLYLPEVAERWVPMRQWVPQIIQFFSARFGAYAYPQFTVAQAGDGGMEYPMVNFITGRRSPFSLFGVTAHEAAHEWFYAMLGSNEADFAWMDEGFTSYATTEAFGMMTGNDSPSHQGALLSIINAQRNGIFEPLNTPSDFFARNSAYGVAAYSGGEMIAEVLGYVLSEPTRDAFFRAYVERFRFRHPTPYDVEKTAEDVSGLRLDWLFEQLADSDRQLDHAVSGLENVPVDGGYRTTLTIEQRGSMVMPADVALTLADGSTHHVHVPLSLMEGHKPVPAGWTVAPPWPWTSPRHLVTLTLPARAVDAVLDPEGQTPDHNRLNNTLGLPRQARFLQPPQPDWFHYGVGYRPLVQYADAFGVGVGAQVRGAYLFAQHRFQATLKLWPQVLLSGGEDPQPERFGTEESALDGLDVDIRYTTPLHSLSTRTEGALQVRKHLGLMENTARLTQQLGAGGQHTAALTLSHQYRGGDRVFGNTPNRRRQSNFAVGHLASAILAYTLENEQDRLTAAVELGGALQSNFDRAGGRLTSANRFTLDLASSRSLGPFDVGMHLRFGFGAEALAAHKRYRLGAATLEDRWRNDAFRTLAAGFEDPLSDAHFIALDAPGPVAYALRGVDNPSLRFNGGPPSGRNLMAARLTPSVTPFGTGHAWLRPLHAGAFFGIGSVWSGLLSDAGLQVSYDVGSLRPLQRWTGQSDVLSGLHLVALAPLWVSDPEQIGEVDALAFRWLLGVAMR